MEQWKGVAMVHDPEKQNARQCVLSNASASFGGGAWWGSQWIQISKSQGMGGMS